MEQWDLYDENRNLTQLSVERGKTIPDGLRHLSVHIWIVNSKHEFLIQKRSANKKKFPNMWSMTGGAVLKGESSAQGAIREASEELGIALNMHDAAIVHTILRKDNFVDVWLVHQDFDISQVKKQDEEVSEVKWASIDEINTLIQNNLFTPSVLDGLSAILKKYEM